jgi:hypothetical protein
VSADTAQRAAETIIRLSAQATDLVSLWQGSTEVLARQVPHWQAPCWYTLDPASLLMTSHYQSGLDEFPHQWLVCEYYDDDVNGIVEVVRSSTGMSTLHEATDGHPDSSPRWHRKHDHGR